MDLRKGPKGLTDEIYGFINRQKVLFFLIDSYLIDSAFTEVKKEAEFKTRYVKGVPFVNRRYTEGDLFRERWYIKG